MSSGGTSPPPSQIIACTACLVANTPRPVHLPYPGGPGGPGAYPLGLCLPTEQWGEGSPFRPRLRLVAKPVNGEGLHICICGSTARPLARRHRAFPTNREVLAAQDWRLPVPWAAPPHPQCPGRPQWSLAIAGLARETRPPGTRSSFLFKPRLSSLKKNQQVLTYRERSAGGGGSP